jgi:hypothetical protein
MPPQLHHVPTIPAPETKENEEKSEAEIVMAMVTALKETMTTMLDKVDKLQGQEKKHYDSLRRGLKRIKEGTSEGVPQVSSPTTEDVFIKLPTEVVSSDTPSPCCICNYCLKCTPLNRRLMKPMSLLMFCAEAVITSRYVLIVSQTLNTNITPLTNSLFKMKIAARIGNSLKTFNPVSRPEEELNMQPAAIPAIRYFSLEYSNAEHHWREV